MNYEHDVGVRGAMKSSDDVEGTSGMSQSYAHVMNGKGWQL